ncbi:MAG: hypothetical protein ACI87E_002073 [Mariniblastus sp.]
MDESINWAGKWRGSLFPLDRSLDHLAPTYRRRFDESIIILESLDMYPYAFTRNNIWQGETTSQKGWSAFNRLSPADKTFQNDKNVKVVNINDKRLPTIVRERLN